MVVWQFPLNPPHSLKHVYLLYSDFLSFIPLLFLIGYLHYYSCSLLYLAVLHVCSPNSKITIAYCVATCQWHKHITTNKFIRLLARDKCSLLRPLLGDKRNAPTPTSYFCLRLSYLVTYTITILSSALWPFPHYPFTSNHQQTHNRSMPVLLRGPWPYYRTKEQQNTLVLITICKLF